MSDLISRADAIEAVAKLNRYDVDERNRLREYTPFHGLEVRTFIEVTDLYDAISALPSADAVDVNEVTIHYKPYPSADTEPKWNCTANFIAEQLERLRNMTDEEKWEFFIKFFSPSASVVRCKDCDRKLGSTECPCCTKEYHINEEKFYCAWGERREP